MSPEENFLRYTQESVFSWYRAADEKARTILGFTGVFLSILVGALIAEYAESGGSTARLDGVGLLLFVVALACHFGAVLFSTTALWSRGVFAPRKAGIAFFGDIANFDSAADLEHAVRAEAAQGLYVDDLARNILVLCKNTRLKHRLVDAAAVSSGLALLTTMCLVVILLIDSTWL